MPVAEERSARVRSPCWRSARRQGPTAAAGSVSPPAPAAIWLTTRDNSAPPRKLFELPHTVGMSATDTEPVVDLVWTPDSAHLVAITRLAGDPARSRVFLIDAAGAPEPSDPSLDSNC